MTRGATARNLKGLFSQLGVPGPNAGHVYETARLARDSRYRVGRDHQGNATVLIETTGVRSASILSDFEGRHLRIGHGVNCSVSEAGVEVGRGEFSVITCIEADDQLKERFFDAVETLLRSLGETPTAEELRRVVAGLIELFRLATQPSRGTLQGLWAELWLIARAREPVVLLDAWHAEPTDIYDFNSGPERLEIKSSGDRTRRHHFSFQQLTPPVGTRVAICSVFAERSGGGLTIATLIERIRRRITEPQALRRLDYIVAGTLGRDWRAGVEASFDSELASESLNYYSVEAIPSLPSDIPPEVSDIRFVSDLSNAEALSPGEMLRFGELFAASVPADQ